MTGNEIRRAFLDFFAACDHTVKASAPLIPDDPTVLFTIAGMVPFKQEFLGDIELEYTRAASAQKCIRTNDIENVGVTARHHTFFEMLGNFSFGDYFKEEAIAWSWEFLTSTLKLPQDKLYVTTYKDDDEAVAIWRDKIGLAEERIYRFGDKDNFWNMGPTGPCGPCSEIFYDLGAEAGCGRKECDVGCDCDRYLEVWNLVFTQFDRQEDGRKLPLPRCNIDTGMGLERLAAVVQGVTDNYQTDLFLPIIRQAEEMCGRQAFGADKEATELLKMVADHARAACFLIADGVLPSNEGRGYILRRILRRAAGGGRLMGREQAFVHLLVPTVVAVMQAAYPELGERQQHIISVIENEEAVFASTLERARVPFGQIVAATKKAGQSEISGQQAFTLYDTYGLPFHTSRLMAQQEGLTIDEPGFVELMQAHQERSRQDRQGQGLMDEHLEAIDVYSKFNDTNYVGYDQRAAPVRVLAILAAKKSQEELVSGASGEVILDQTPFYAESGGQVGDQGELLGASVQVQVTGTKQVHGAVAHLVTVRSGILRVGDSLGAEVAVSSQDTRKNHSATHLIHAALASVLGLHVVQAGSLVQDTRLRFDFTHKKAVSAAELSAVEELVNSWVQADLPVTTESMSVDQARNSGAKALFGEKYGDQVRVVTVAAVGAELCGGTHVSSTGKIGGVRIISESSVAAGVRRVEAITGVMVARRLVEVESQLQALAGRVGCSLAELDARVDKMLEEAQQLKHISRSNQEQQVVDITRRLMQYQLREKPGAQMVVGNVEQLDPKLARTVVDNLKNELDNLVVLLSFQNKDKIGLVCGVSGSLTSKLKAGKVISEIAGRFGGRGGGRPDFAQGGISASSDIESMLSAAEAYIWEQI